MDAVHVPFGEAAHTAPAIRVLVDAAHVLPLEDRLVLGAQAGAHLARSESEKGTLLPVDTERTLLFDLVAEFHRRAAELVPEPAREAAGEELSRCVATAGIAAVTVTSDRMDTFIGTWNDLVDREPPDEEGRAAIRREECRLLTDAEAQVGRCRAYLDRLTALPLEDASRDKRATIDRRTTIWAAELRRLRGLL
jgi:hypothetical protein